MKVVLDTNVLYAAFTSRGGLCARLARLSQQEAGDVTAILQEHGQVVAPAAVPEDAVGDTDDLPVLGTAIAGGVRMCW